MGDFSKRVQSDNKHLQDLTSGQFRHYTAAGNYTVRDDKARLIKVILNTNGATVTVRDGSEIIGIIAADAPEGTYEYGVFCDESLKVDLGDTCDATVVFA